MHQHAIAMTSGLTLCGCGWLGKHLASSLSDIPSLIGSTRSQDNFASLSELNVEPVKFQLGDSPFALTRLSHGHTVILNIPPGRKHPTAPNFVPHMLELIDAFMQVHVGHLIFISTTSVYGEAISGTITEDSAPLPETESGRAHLAIEHHLKGYPDQRYSVVRLAGLVGPDRHPIRFLAGKKLDNGQRRVNLVHVADVVSALKVLMAQGGYGQTLHLCSNSHPTRGDYYTAAAQRLGLAVPVFEDYRTLPPDGKVIDASHSWQSLGLTPAFASPYDMLEGIRL